jgi:hypothetical protein
MKKKLMVLLMLVSIFIIGSTAFAAPLTDVPANHWAYDSVNRLVQDGIIEGYGDGTFKGEKTLTRYEFAIAVSKAIDKYNKADTQQRVLIDKLSAEFATELNTIGVRLSKLENNASTVKFTGYIKINGGVNCSLSGTSDPISNPASHYIYDLVALKIAAPLNDKMDFIGSLDGKNTNNNYSPSDGKTYSSSTFFLGTAYLKYKNAIKGTDVTVGREPLVLGQTGLVASTISAAGGVDDVRLSFNYGKFSAFAAVADLNGYVYGYNSSNIYLNNNSILPKSETSYTNKGINSRGVKIGNLTWNPDSAFQLSGGLLYSDNSNNYAYKQKFVGATINLTTDWSVVGDYVKNSLSADPTQNKGIYYSLNYKGAKFNKIGSWGAHVDYTKVGANAIDFGISSICAFSTTKGVKGPGAGFNYTVAKNAIFSTYLTLLKSYDGSTKFDRSICTTLQLIF